MSVGKKRYCYGLMHMYSALQIARHPGVRRGKQLIHLGWQVNAGLLNFTALWPLAHGAMAYGAWPYGLIFNLIAYVMHEIARAREIL